MYVAIDRKPESGCEIQNSACGRSMIMMRLKIVKTAEEEATHTIMDEHLGMLHGTKVIISLVQPWLGSGRTVCGDSYFASVGAANVMEKRGMGFLGIIKTATRHFPMAYLTNIEMQSCGEREGVVYRDKHGVPKLMAFVWMDRDRRYFIASSSSLRKGTGYVRDRWRQVDTSPDADAERVELTVDQPEACQHYYQACGKVDQHNRHRQATLKLETKFVTHDWA
jgi:hypothetical protein